MDAIKGEKILSEKKLIIEVMPTPTSITKSCGISILVKEEDFTLVKDLIYDNKILVNHIYLMENNICKDEIKL
ncbi:hypothetical protein GCM10008905_23320 [Clostridium malenominatum]|uniref:Putative Se/S carrier protein-like domain-containing protein n=2 Tax=Clostridium malenominatum TaxID=1539 RepID=A0ABP3U879_9CLOT